MQISEMRRADALNSEAVLGMMISADSGLNIYYFIHIFPIALFPVMMYIGKRAVLRGRRTPIITY